MRLLGPIEADDRKMRKIILHRIPSTRSRLEHSQSARLKITQTKVERTEMSTRRNNRTLWSLISQQNNNQIMAQPCNRRALTFIIIRDNLTVNYRRSLQTFCHLRSTGCFRKMTRREKQTSFCRRSLKKSPTEKKSNRKKKTL